VSWLEFLPLSGVAAAIAATLWFQQQNDTIPYEGSQQPMSLKKLLVNLRYIRVEEFRHRACGSVQLLRGTEAAFMRRYAGKRKKGRPEHVVACAIRHPSGVIYAAPAPGRHHHLIWAMDAFGHAGIEHTRKQGFLTNTGRFVNRITGLTLANEANQIIKKHPSYRELYTEDMW
jgi:hypothetical protein